MARSAWVRTAICCIASGLATPGAVVAVALAQAQAPASPVRLIPRTKEEREWMNQAANRVALNLQVTDAAGMPVTGLKASDFTVLDNQKQQTFAHFREIKAQDPAAQLRVMLVLDGINDGGSAVGHLKKDLGKFLSQLRKPLAFPVTLVSVTEADVVKTAPSTDPSVLAAQLAQLARRPHSPDCERDVTYQGARAQSYPDCLNTHVQKSINALLSLLGEKQNLQERTILIWAGPGWPEFIAPVGVGSPQIRGMYPELLVLVTKALREGHVTLDAISWGEFAHPQRLGRPVMSVTAGVPSTPDELAEENMTLPALARRSGGQAIAKAEHFAGAFAALLAGGGEV